MNPLINVEKISPIQTILILSLSRIAIILLWFNFSNQDIWIIEILSILYTALLCAPLLILSKKFTTHTLIEYLQIIIGKWIGKFLGILYVAFFLFIAILDLALFDNIIKPINFPETPDYAILLLALITCTYGVNKGLECIVRSTEVFAPLVFATIAFYAILQIPEMDFKVFLPILADSTFYEINSQAFIKATRINDIIVLAMLVPSIQKKGNPIKIFFWAVLIINLFALIIIVPTLAGLGLEVSHKTFDPYYLFIKQINIYDFITRIEFLIVAAWNISMFAKISILFYLATISFAQIFGLKKRKRIILLMAIIIFVIAIKSGIIRSDIVFKVLEVYVPYINLTFMFVIPGLVLSIFFLKDKFKAKSKCDL